MNLRKAVENRFGTTAKIKIGRMGDMTVLVNGKPVFGYKQEGKMPPIPDLLDRIEAARA